MSALAVLVRLLHIAFAVILAGGAVYQLFVVQPLLETLDGEQRREMREKLAARWRPIVIAALFILLLSGLINFLMFKVSQFGGHPSVAFYHGLIGLKIVLALGVLHIMTMLALPGEKFDKKYRERAGFWLSLAVGLFVVIIILGAVANNFERIFGAVPLDGPTG